MYKETSKEKLVNNPLILFFISYKIQSYHNKALYLSYLSFPNKYFSIDFLINESICALQRLKFDFVKLPNLFLFGNAKILANH